MADFSVAAYAVVANDGNEVLLTRRRASGEWVLPGGTVEAGEPPWDAAVREVSEETGLEIEVERLVGTYVKEQETDLVFVFAATLVGGELRASDESDAAAFFPATGLPSPTSDNHRNRIDDALRNEERAVLRVQPSQGPEAPPGSR
jgi:8-oxo-dGTP diphosphatase